MSTRVRYNWRPNHKKKYQARYKDSNGIERSKQFATAEERDLFRIVTEGELLQNEHVPDRASKKISEAGKIWLSSTEVLDLRKSTQDQYESHLRLHIYPLIGSKLLSKFDVGDAKNFRDKLRHKGTSDIMIQKIMTTLGCMLDDARERKFCKTNAVKEMRRNRRSKEKRKLLQVGVDIPRNADVQEIIKAAEGKWRAMILTLIFTGVRSNELLGLCWSDLELDKQVIHIKRALDRGTLTLHEPKTGAGIRSIPIIPMLANTLKEYKLSHPPRRDGSEFADLVFHNKGRPTRAHHFVTYGLLPTLVRAKIIKPPVRRKGRPFYEDRKYGWPHCYRHWYASWCINSKEDGGLALDAKRVSERLGHSSINITLNTYGHLFPQKDQRAALAEAERAFFGS